MGWNSYAKRLIKMYDKTLNKLFSQLQNEVHPERGSCVCENYSLQIILLSRAEESLHG